MSKRRFWQIHLSTAVVLMILAGVLLFGNVRIAQIQPVEAPGYSTIEEIAFVHDCVRIIAMVVSLATLSVVAGLFEYVIRRRKRGKEKISN